LSKADPFPLNNCRRTKQMSAYCLPDNQQQFASSPIATIPVCKDCMQQQ
jgi:hypothetical protein